MLPRLSPINNSRNFGSKFSDEYSNRFTPYSILPRRPRSPLHSLLPLPNLSRGQSSPVPLLHSSNISKMDQSSSRLPNNQSHYSPPSLMSLNLPKYPLKQSESRELERSNRFEDEASEKYHYPPQNHSNQLTRLLQSKTELLNAIRHRLKIWKTLPDNKMSPCDLLSEICPELDTEFRIEFTKLSIDDVCETCKLYIHDILIVRMYSSGCRLKDNFSIGKRAVLIIRDSVKLKMIQCKQSDDQFELETIWQDAIIKKSDSYLFEALGFAFLSLSRYLKQECKDEQIYIDSTATLRTACAQCNLPQFRVERFPQTDKNVQVLKLLLCNVEMMRRREDCVNVGENILSIVCRDTVWLLMQLESIDFSIKTIDNLLYLEVSPAVREFQLNNLYDLAMGIKNRISKESASISAESSTYVLTCQSENRDDQQNIMNDTDLKVESDFSDKIISRKPTIDPELVASLYESYANKTFEASKRPKSESRPVEFSDSTIDILKPENEEAKISTAEEFRVKGVLSKIARALPPSGCAATAESSTALQGQTSYIARLESACKAANIPLVPQFEAIRLFEDGKNTMSNRWLCLSLVAGVICGRSGVTDTKKESKSAAYKQVVDILEKRLAKKSIDFVSFVNKKDNGELYWELVQKEDDKIVEEEKQEGKEESEKS